MGQPGRHKSQDGNKKKISENAKK